MRWWIYSILVVSFCGRIFAQEGEQNRHTDSRARFVHRINLWDEDGRNISMKDPEQRPYSPAQTCGRCHPTLFISHGWHFNAPDKSVPPGRAGEPWMVQDATTRTLLPVSYRNWPGTWSPKDAGLSDWQFVLMFGRQMPGGGAGMNPTTQPVDPKARWQFSGRLEVDCMICHSADNSHDPTDRAKLQIEINQNFKWAPTIAMGLAHVPGSAKTLKIEPPEEGSNEPPKKPTLKMTYDKTRFDAEDKVLFNVARKVPNNRCYFCHTANSVGADVPPLWQHDGDVHLVKGMTCTDCHRESIDHMTTRSYEWEWRDRKDASLETLTCRGCHLGAPHGQAATAHMGGKLGSPRPEHRGLPAIHFERLSCTACHSGPWPSLKSGFVQTSMAHALGLEKPTRTAETVPRIEQPIFVRGADGKIAPHRAVWPNFWGRMSKDNIAVIPPSVVKEAAGDDLPAVRELTADAGKPLSDEQISKTLTALSTGDAATQTSGSSGQAVYVSGGIVYGLDKGKVVKVADDRHEAQPYEWAFAHDVRPKSMSLGIRGCTDCHSSQGAIYFGEVTPVGAFAAGNGVTRSMTELRGESTMLADAWVGSFMGRSLFKVLIFICGSVVAAVLLTAGVRGLGAWLVRET